MLAVILKCKPGSRFHLGQSSMRQNETLTDTAEIIHSDVLFGAFIHTVAQHISKDLEKWKDYFKSGKLIFSSAYYCLEYEQKKVYLLPKPISLNTIDITANKTLQNAQKKLKKVKFISKGVWEKQLLPQDWLAKDRLCFLPENRVVVLKEELNIQATAFKLSEKSDIQKVKIRSAEEKGSLYTQTDLVIMGNEDVRIYWYFLVDMQELSESEQKEVKKLIEIMAIQGIGGERSTGCGQIESVEYDDRFALPIFPDSHQYVSLSLSIPTVEEQNELLAYQIIQRGGMYYGSEKKQIKIVNMLTEGAVLSNTILGRIADLSDENKKHWRGGTSFCVPIPPAYQYLKR
jgi:CRISPR type III-A-associated RAMP protein Csm4